MAGRPLLRVGEVVEHDPVTAVQLDLRMRRADVLHGLDAVRLDLAGEHEAVGLDRRGLRTVVRRLGIDPDVALHLQAELGRGLLEVAREARRVGRLRVPDLDRLASVVLGRRRQGRALDDVGRNDARVRALARRVVLVGLTGLRARLVRGQAHVGVGRADLRDARLVEDRKRDLRRARVVLAQVGDRGRIAHRLAGVLADRRVVGLAGRCGRVVQRGVGDRVVADLVVGRLRRRAWRRSRLPGTGGQRLPGAAGWSRPSACCR